MPDALLETQPKGKGTPTVWRWVRCWSLVAEADIRQVMLVKTQQ